jgi:azurin
MMVVALATLPGCDRQPIPKAEYAITVNEQFKITPTQFECHSGQPVRIRITNVIPANGPDLAHNLVLTQTNVDVEAFGQATFSTTAESNYIPQQFTGQVIAKTSLIHPGESNELTFVAPSEPGSYPILCTFPGHCALGMRAILLVR